MNRSQEGRFKAQLRDGMGYFEEYLTDFIDAPTGDESLSTALPRRGSDWAMNL